MKRTGALLFFSLIYLVSISTTAARVGQRKVSFATIFVDSQSNINSNCGDSLQNACSTIASAVALAQPGDVLLVSAGTYNESAIQLSINGSIFIQSQLCSCIFNQSSAAESQ